MSLTSLLLFLYFGSSICDEGPGPFRILKEWPKVVYDTKCLKNPDRIYYRSSKNQISEIKIFRNRIYLSIPRQDGVPVTLGRISLYAGYKNAPIEPFPSWEFQDDKNCSNLISVVGFEIDASGIMWVVDEGKTDACPPKLILFDLETLDYVQTGEGKGPNCKPRVGIVKTFLFPENAESSERASRLGRIVVDEDGPRAYVADSGTENPGVFVYDFRTDTCRKFPLRESQSLPTAAKGGGLALSPPSRNRTLYYSPRGSLALYSVSVETLKNNNSTEKLGGFTRIADKTCVSDAMTADSQGNLYLGLECESSVVKWNPRAGDFRTKKKILASDSNFTWIDSFAFDLMGNLYFTVNSGPGNRGVGSKIYCGRMGFVRSYLYKQVLPFN